jgi:hypothetical protein
VKASRLVPTLLVTAVVAAGCVGAKREPAAAAGSAAKPAARTAMPSGTATAPVAPVTPRGAAASAPVPPAPAAAVAAPASPLTPSPPAQKLTTPDPSVRPAPRPPAGAGLPAAVSPAPVTSARQASPPAPAAGAVAAPVPAPAAAPTLDLKSLELRLRETRAIGVFTKLALKNQVDDLLDKVRGHHAGRPIPPLPVLKQNFDGLMMKVLALLQNDDPSLAKTIATSREALWGILSDPVKFSSI